MEQVQNKYWYPARGRSYFFLALVVFGAIFVNLPASFTWNTDGGTSWQAIFSVMEFVLCCIVLGIDACITKDTTKAAK